MTPCAKSFRTQLAEASEQTSTDARRHLNCPYDLFVSRFGPLNAAQKSGHSLTIRTSCCFCPSTETKLARGENRCGSCVSRIAKGHVQDSRMFRPVPIVESSTDPDQTLNPAGIQSFICGGKTPTLRRSPESIPERESNAAAMATSTGWRLSTQQVLREVLERRAWPEPAARQER